jgi:hypothetical protein
MIGSMPRATTDALCAFVVIIGRDDESSFNARCVGCDVSHGTRRCTCATALEPTTADAWRSSLTDSTGGGTDLFKRSAVGCETSCEWKTFCGIRLNNRREKGFGEFWNRRDGVLIRMCRHGGVWCGGSNNENNSNRFIF